MIFANYLSRVDLVALVELLGFLANADGNLTSDEIAFLDAVCDNVGLNTEDIMRNVGKKNLREILQPVAGDRQKRIIIQELVNLAYADGDYSDAEKKGVREIALILGIDEQLILKIEKWVYDGIEWTKKGFKLILEGE